MAFTCLHCQAALELHYRACPSCGEAISDFIREHADKPIDGKYEIISRLGVGGMGEVYKVRHVHLDAVRVIKLMRPHVAATKGAHERFVREAKLATRIQHPNVATLHDFASLPDGSYYMVWEFIDGVDLSQLIRSRGSLSPADAARVSIEALSGLQAVHDAGVVHRDISPENVMLTVTPSGEERIKIIDLGIAKQWEGGASATETGMFVGKWKYCSPEHLGILPAGETIDGRADLYSFGIVMYEMLAGRAPFEAQTPHEYVVLHTREAPPPLELRALGVPELERIILRSLDKDRTRRFGSARDMIRELRAVQATLGSDVVAPPPPASESAKTVMAATVASVSPPTLAQTPTVVGPTVVVSHPQAVSNPAPVRVVPPTQVDRYRETLLSKTKDFFATPVGKLAAVVLFLGFVALVLPTVVVIIKWTLIAAFILFALIAGWKAWVWYQANQKRS